MHDDFLTSTEVARRLRLKPQTLRRWRQQGLGPGYLRFGDTRRGRVRYARAEVEGWIARQAATGCGAPCPADQSGEAR